MTEEKLRDIALVVLQAYHHGAFLNVSADDPAPMWNVYNSIFFAVTVVTTIGASQLEKKWHSAN